MWNVWVWMALAIVFSVIMRLAGDAPRSPYQNFEYVLFALMALGYWRGGALFTVAPGVAGYLYVVLVLIFGAAYEATLTIDGTGIGGMHRDTWASYILAFGDYLLIALLSLFVIWHTRAGFREMFFFAGGKSLTEGLIFTGLLTATILSPQFWLAPLTLAYYVLAYASFVALPLLIIDPASLWKPDPKPKPIPWFWMAGFVLAFAGRLLWGLGYGPLAEWLFGLPENVLEQSSDFHPNSIA